MLTEKDKIKLTKEVEKYIALFKPEEELSMHIRLAYSHLHIPSAILYAKEQYNRYILIGEVGGRLFKTSD